MERSAAPRFLRRSSPIRAASGSIAPPAPWPLTMSALGRSAHGWLRGSRSLLERDEDTGTERLVWITEIDGEEVRYYYPRWGCGVALAPGLSVCFRLKNTFDRYFSAASFAQGAPS